MKLFSANSLIEWIDLSTRGGGGGGCIVYRIKGKVQWATLLGAPQFIVTAMTDRVGREEVYLSGIMEQSQLSLTLGREGLLCGFVA